MIVPLAGSEVSLGSYSGFNGPDDSPCPYGNFTEVEKDQYLFTAAELTAAGGSAGEILALSFYVESVNGCQPLNRFSIAIGHTTLSQFGSDFIEGLTNVHLTNPYQPEQGWNRHTFSTPFTWDGTSNLVIQAGYRNMNTTSANPSVRYANTSPFVRTLYQTGGIIGVNQSYHRPQIILTMNPVTLPLIQNFDSGSFPAGWTQARDFNAYTDDWSIDDTNFAGSSTFEAKWDMSGYAGSSRLISPLVKLDGASEIQVSFRHGYIAYADQPGLTVRLEYSYDLLNWLPASWSHGSMDGFAAGKVFSIVVNPQQPYLYLGWTVYNPNNYPYCDYWSVDEISVAQAPMHDIWAMGIGGVNEVVDLGESVTPQARILNVGASTENLQLMISSGNGAYNELVEISNLAPGELRSVAFPSFTPIPGGAEIMMHAILAADLNPQNNEATRTFYSLNLDKQAFAYAFNDNLNFKKNVTFNLGHPELLSELPQDPLNERQLSCADWIAGQWYAAEYQLWDEDENDRIWQINQANGSMTENGITGVNRMVGMAWDPVSSTLYGATNSHLYRLNRLTGVPILIGPLGVNIAVHGIAFDYRNAILYAVGGEDASDPKLYTLNTSTGAATVVGHLGKWINVPGTYCDCAFDQDNGNLYLCATSGYWNKVVLYIDTNNGSAWKVGYFPFQSSSTAQRSYTGFAIPYTFLAPPQVSISEDGTLFWAQVPGAQSYNIYAAEVPEGPYNYLASTTALVWNDPSFSQPQRRFYRVCSAIPDTRQASSRDNR